MPSSELLPGHFTIRTKSDKWEVLLVYQDDTDYFPVCESYEDAVALANSGPLNAAFEGKKKCDLENVKESIAAFEKYDLTHTKLYRRLKFLAEDLMK